MLVDFDDIFVEHALKNGYVTAEQVSECRRVQKKEQAEGRRYYLGQVLIRKRFLSCADFLTIENELGHKLYECANCKARYGIDDLSEKGTLPCRGCGAEVRIDGAGLSIVEILASRDPRDLTISLCPTNGAEPQPPPIRVQTSTRLTQQAGATDTRRAKSKLNRAVLELTKEELSGLQRYEVLEEVGRGGMGLVFKARQIDIDRICALKVIKAGPSVPEVQINRFVQEARAAAGLNHPNIVTVYDFGRFRDVFYIAMEFIPGTPLAKLIHENGGLSRDRALDVACDVLEAVAYAHEKGVIHRDLKPQNILVETERGRARLIDFGLAKDHSAAALGLTQTGQILGSPFYLSPEQTRGESKNVDPRSDVFAIGVILYEMLTKTRPFSGKSAAEVYAKILKERPAPPSAIEPDVEQALQAIVLKALEKEPEDRFQTADEFRRAIEDFRSGRDTAEEVPATTAGSKTRSGRTKSLTGRHASVASQRTGIPKRASDRSLPGVTRGRTSAAMPVASLEGSGTAHAGSNSFVFAIAGALAIAGVFFLASQGPSRPPRETDPTPRPIDPAVVVTRTTPDEPGPQPLDEEGRALRELEGLERATPDDWGELLVRWGQVGDRFPRQAARAAERVAALEKQASAEAEQLLARADELVAKQQWGEAAHAIAAVLPRFENVRSQSRLAARARSAEDEARSIARAAVSESERKLQGRDFLAAMAAVTLFTRTGVEDADKSLEDQRARVRQARNAAELAQRTLVEKAVEEASRKVESARQLRKERRFADATRALDEALRAPLDDVQRGQVALIRSEVVLLAFVIEGAGKADLAAAIAQKKDVTLEISKALHVEMLRVHDGVVSARVPGGGESDYEILKLPARSIVQLFELSARRNGPEAPLARALFLLNEGENELARAAFEEAKRRGGVDPTPWEGRFASLPEEQPAKTPDRPPSSTGQGRTQGEEKPVKDDGAMVAVPAGVFKMGTDEVTLLEHDGNRASEMPSRPVTLEAFSFDKYEVSNHQYGKFLKYLADNKSKAHRLCHKDEPRDKDHTPAHWGSVVFGGDAHPVVGVDWFDAYAYAAWARKRLPTEAEWERAARGTDGRAFPWGNAWDPRRCVCAEHWTKEDTRDDAGWQHFKEWLAQATRVTLPIDSLEEGRSPSGAYHLAGNVAEWVSDWYDPSYYHGAPNRNPAGPESGTIRSVRGGTWGDRTPAFNLTTARAGVAPLTRTRWLGFRCAQDARQK